jgi:cytochrome c oxidase assembly protein subunit 11
MIIAEKNKSTALKLFVVSVAMFGFGYALVPLYDVFCDLTGLNGKTGEITISEADSLTIDTNRMITVEFDTNVNSKLEWDFRAEQTQMQVYPGQVHEAVFRVTNLTDRQITGQAVPSVAPAKASLYFNKTECFCFTQQVLAPGESKQMPVRFVVDPGMPGSIQMLTLSYTFFLSPEQVVTKKSDLTEPEPNS